MSRAASPIVCMSSITMSMNGILCKRSNHQNTATATLSLNRSHFFGTRLDALVLQHAFLPVLRHGSSIAALDLPNDINGCDLRSAPRYSRAWQTDEHILKTNDKISTCQSLNEDAITISHDAGLKPGVLPLGFWHTAALRRMVPI